MDYIDFGTWQKAVKDAYPQEANKIKFKGRIERGLQTVSAEIPGQERSYGVWTESKHGGSGKVLEAAIEDGTLTGYAIKLKSGGYAKSSNGSPIWWPSTERANNSLQQSNSNGDGQVVKVKLKRDRFGYNGSSIVEGMAIEKLTQASLLEEDDLLIDPSEPSSEPEDLLIDPEESGEQFDLLIDGDPEDEEPIVQQSTHDDGSIEPLGPDQDLLIDDLSH